VKRHVLKTWPEYFVAIIEGRKTFEIRKNDRGFSEGDLVVLKEFNPIKQIYTGRYAEYRIGCVVDIREFGLQIGYCAFSLLPRIATDDNMPIFIDRFDSVSELHGKQRTYENIKRAVLQAGRFSVFDVVTTKDGKIFTQLCQDPELEITTLQYPWTGVKLKEAMK
jgi:hypothetical protein